MEINRTKPAIKAKYRVESVPGEAVFLLSETESHMLEGRYADQLVPLIDGTRTVPQIIAAVHSAMPPAEVYASLETLARSGHLENSPWPVPALCAPFWSELGIDPDLLETVLANAVVEVSAFASTDAAMFAGMASAFGVRVGYPGSVHVVLTDDYLRPELVGINRDCLTRNVPLLMVKPVGVRLWVGPLVIPGRTACWRCLAFRLDRNREIENYILQRRGQPRPFVSARARAAVFEQQAYAMVMPQLLRLLSFGGNVALENTILIADVTSFSFETHPVWRVPQCLECGSPTAMREGEPFILEPTPVSSVGQEGMRSQDPERTFRQVEQHISPVTGVVKELIPSRWHGVGPLRTYLAGNNFALYGDSILSRGHSVRQFSSGKGRTDIQAKTSAVCEALERFSGIFQGSEMRIQASLEHLGSEAVDPRQCMLYSEQQYRDRQAWMARGSAFQMVPLPFDPSAQIEWTPVWSLTDKRKRYLPTSYLYYNYPDPVEKQFCFADSNGAAAGTTPADALLQGLLEIVERDAVAIWWYNRLQFPGVDVAAFDSEYAEELSSFYASHNREYWVLDLTNDVGIPAFVAINRRIGGPSEDIVLGFGAHLDPQIALTRAVTEMNQFMPGMLDINPDGSAIYSFDDHAAVKWWSTATLKSEPYLAPTGSPRRPSDYEGKRYTDAVTAVNDVRTRLEALGHEVLVLDQTRPEVGLPVVKAIVPGMRHFWARYAPGRLYEVPVRMNFNGSAISETDLNPIAMFL